MSRSGKAAIHGSNLSPAGSGTRRSAARLFNHSFHRACKTFKDGSSKKLGDYQVFVLPFQVLSSKTIMTAAALHMQPTYYWHFWQVRSRLVINSSTARMRNKYVAPAVPDETWRRRVKAGVGGRGFMHRIARNRGGASACDVEEAQRSTPARQPRILGRPRHR